MFYSFLWNYRQKVVKISSYSNLIGIWHYKLEDLCGLWKHGCAKNWERGKNLHQSSSQPYHTVSFLWFSFQFPKNDHINFGSMTVKSESVDKLQWFLCNMIKKCLLKIRHSKPNPNWAEHYKRDRRNFSKKTNLVFPIDFETKMFT